jgi:sulfur dioxygenase
MIQQHLFDPETSTLTYLLADPHTREAVLIDPVLERVDDLIAMLARLGLTLRYTLETHVHADHVTAGAALREALGSQTAVHAAGGAVCADRRLVHGDRVQLGALTLEVLHTPGHTAGDVCYRLGDRVFTGDTLLINGCGRTDFQQGSADALYRSVHEHLFSLPESTLVFPGHDYNGRTVSTIGWEKKHNPRLGGGRDRASFVALMAGLGLAHPRHIARAVPANLACGVEPTVAEGLAQASGPTPHGFRDLSPWQAAVHKTQLMVVDVREPSEFVGPLGHIDGARLVPLGTLAGQSFGWERDAPMLVVCRSGGRSAAAAKLLTELGFGHVFNLAGGMKGWGAAKLPVISRAS